MSNNTKTIPTSEYAAVAAAVEKYVDGLRLGVADKVAEAFYDGAIMFGGAKNGTVRGGPIDSLYSFVEANGGAPKIEARIDVLAITPTTAVVRVDMEHDAVGAAYTDFHTLVNVDGSWQVIAKIYHRYDA